ncbi:hypothetical protein [Glutamicibacter uratoxydans]|uniref:hypothetical protein n=1 Tax=Glutamicibacter uratoxydans TaxID=43667 RepID=UPI0015811292|nr:hypothetical protein [Glutamicibacter uratoxydans]
MAVLQVKVFPALDTPLEPAPEQKAPPRTVPRVDFLDGAGFVLAVGFGFGFAVALGATFGTGLALALGFGLADGFGDGLTVCFGAGLAVFCGVGTTAAFGVGVEASVAVGGMSLVAALVAVDSLNGFADSVVEAVGEPDVVDAWDGTTAGVGLVFSLGLQAATERDSAAIASMESGFFKSISLGIPLIKT